MPTQTLFRLSPSTPATGFLTPGTVSTSGLPIAAGARPVSIAVDPAGKFAYVANFASNDVSTYSINATTGALTSVGFAPTLSGGFGPSFITVAPGGKFAYVTNESSNIISAFAIDPIAGTLTSAGADVIAVAGPKTIVIATTHTVQ
jgi:6-phosphogluconolactonase (cycloisomerase 2 family)